MKRRPYADSDREKLLVAIRLAAMAGLAYSQKDYVNYSYISLLPRDETDGQIRTACMSERIFENENQLLAALDLSLAGREAEIYFFGENEASIASTQYLRQAGELARLHSRLYGKGSFLRQGSPEHNSEQLRMKMDNEVIDLIEKRKEIVKLTIKNKERKISKLAEKLIKKEAMSKKEAENVLGSFF